MDPRPTLPLTLLLTLALSGCGGGGDPTEQTRAGYAQLNSGNPAAARVSFERALEKLQPSDPDYARAALGLAQVVAASEPARAKELFLGLARAQAVQENDYQLVARALVAGRHFNEATALVEAGMKAFPESPRMAELRDHVGDSALRTGAEVPAGLRGLGYVGSD